VNCFATTVQCIKIYFLPNKYDILCLRSSVPSASGGGGGPSKKNWPPLSISEVCKCLENGVCVSSLHVISEN